MEPEPGEPEEADRSGLTTGGVGRGSGAGRGGGATDFRLITPESSLRNRQLACRDP